MVFLAEEPGAPGAPGKTLLVRHADHASSALEIDARLVNDLESFEHPGRRVLTMRQVQVPGAQAAVELDAEYPDGNLGGAKLRKLDLIVRTPGQGSYHLVFVGPVSSVSDETISRLASGFRLGG